MDRRFFVGASLLALAGCGVPKRNPYADPAGGILATAEARRADGQQAPLDPRGADAPPTDGPQPRADNVVAEIESRVASNREKNYYSFFPTSDRPAQGKPWTRMHAGGYTGSLEDARKLLGLTRRQAVIFDTARSNGTAISMEIPNGVILDGLTFSRNGQHFVQPGAAVQLIDPISRWAEIVMVGQDRGQTVFVIRLLGCNNHAVVRTSKSPQLITPPVENLHPTGQVCIWLRVRPDRPHTAISLRAGRDRSGRLLASWGPKQLTYIPGPKVGDYVQVCFDPALISDLDTVYWCDQYGGQRWERRSIEYALSMPMGMEKETKLGDTAW